MTLTPAERTETGLNLLGWQGADYDVIERADWSTDAHLRHLAHGFSYYDEELFFYFWGFNDRQKANLQRIVIASSPAGTVDYQAVTPNGGPTGFFARHTDGTSAGLVSADICWFTPLDIRSYDWVALVPKGFDLDADLPIPTDPIRYFVSGTDAQGLFLGLFALVERDGQPEIYQWHFPGWSPSDWSLDELMNRNDAFLSEHTAQVVEECYPGATRVRAGQEVSE